VVAMVRPRFLTDEGNNTWKLWSDTFGRSMGLCADERFSHQPAGAFCTGFVVGPDVVATAGHCINESTLSNVRFVFGYRMVSDKDANMTFPNGDVFRAVKLLGWSQVSDGPDWALVKLDRPTGRAPLQLSRTRIQDNAPVFVIGHPSGLPAKYAGGANVRDNSIRSVFLANLDTYGGNSGSPVLNERTREVEGILVRGETDFMRVGQCNVSLICPRSPYGCLGEAVTRTSEFIDFLPQGLVAEKAATKGIAQ